MKNMNKVEIAQLANQSYESMEFYRNRYNSMTETERNTLGVGLKTLGQYARENYEAAKAKFEYYTSLLAA